MHGWEGKHLTLAFLLVIWLCFGPFTVSLSVGPSSYYSATVRSTTAALPQEEHNSAKASLHYRPIQSVFVERNVTHKQVSSFLVGTRRRDGASTNISRCRRRTQTAKYYYYYDDETTRQCGGGEQSVVIRPKIAKKL
eukprot:scaffold1581_cov169-Amphora_coffeaeformis.AAC.25